MTNPILWESGQNRRSTFHYCWVTAVYRIPVWNILEPVRCGFELLLVNPQTVRALRGRKTDRMDAGRIAEFLQYGLLRGSFVRHGPPASCET